MAFGLPSVYRSSATILIEQQEIPQELVRTTATSYADQRIQMISQRVMTTATLGKIIKKYDFNIERQDQPSLTAMIEKLRDGIGLDMVSVDILDPRSGRPTTATIAFKLSYENKSPELALNVVNEMVTLYLNENLKARSKATKETSSFLADEADKLNNLIIDLEKKLASFKERNVGNLPDMLDLNLQLMDRIDRQLTDNAQQIRTLEERKIYLQSELAQLNPYSELYSTNGERILNPEDELRALQMQYISLAAEYKENHPTLAMMRKKIENLKQEVSGDYDMVSVLEKQLAVQKTELSALIDRYSDNHKEVEKQKVAINGTKKALNEARRRSKLKQRKENVFGQPDNPAYVQLQAQLEAAEAEIRSIRQTRRELQEKLKGYEERLTNAPQVEREYRTLTRDYENAMDKYNEIRAKQMEADLAESLEKESIGERFTLLEPPMLPEKPIKPNRHAIFILGLILSFAGGIASIAIRESVDPAVYGQKGVFAITQALPLSSIPYIENNQDRRQRVIRRLILFLTSLLIMAVGTAVIHYFFMPLDFIWYEVLSKLGIEVGG